MAGKDFIDDDLPELGMSTMEDDAPVKKDGKDDDFGFDILDDKTSNFRDQLENEERGKDKIDDVVFEVADDQDDGSFEIEEFKDNRKPAEKKKLTRLQREMRLKGEARGQLTEAAKHIQRVSSEAAFAMKEGFRAKRQYAELVKNMATGEITRFNEEIERAREEGNTRLAQTLAEKVADAQSAIVSADKQIARYSEENIENWLYDDKVPDNIKAAANPISTKANDWIDANSEWFKDPNKHGAEIAAARAIDQQMLNEKVFTPGSDEYYNELTRRVALKFPDIEVFTADGKVARVGRQRGGSQRRDTTSSGQQRGSQTAQPGKREVLGRDEQSLLRGLGLNLSDPKVRKELESNRPK